ncbi:MAG: sodium ion-translocating decarboxylase subunit beta [Planctomycetes bacterium]|nr:sodium ion-translocating decarboxylase subunit beta [Planctomycetota bacterium]
MNPVLAISALLLFLWGWYAVGLAVLFVVGFALLLLGLGAARILNPSLSIALGLGMVLANLPGVADSAPVAALCKGGLGILPLPILLLSVAAIDFSSLLRRPWLLGLCLPVSAVVSLSTLGALLPGIAPVGAGAACLAGGAGPALALWSIADLKPAGPFASFALAASLAALFAPFASTMAAGIFSKIRTEENSQDEGEDTAPHTSPELWRVLAFALLLLFAAILAVPQSAVYMATLIVGCVLSTLATERQRRRAEKAGLLLCVLLVFAAGCGMKAELIFGFRTLILSALALIACFLIPSSGVLALNFYNTWAEGMGWKRVDSELGARVLPVYTPEGDKGAILSQSCRKGLPVDDIVQALRLSGWIGLVLASGILQLYLLA